MQLVLYVLDCWGFLSKQGGRTEEGNFSMKEVSWVVGFPLEILYNTGIGAEEADVGSEPDLRLAEWRLQYEQGKKGGVEWY